MKISDFKSVTEWHDAYKKETGGYAPPAAACQALVKTMNTRKMTFPEAYNFLVSEKAIIETGKTVVFDLGKS